MVLEKLDSYTQNNQTRLLSDTITKKKKSKWIEDLKIRPETIKLLEENSGNMLFDISLRNIFLISVSSGKGNKCKR